MTRNYINKKTALRFRLVQKSVHEQLVGGDNGERVYVPLNEASAKHLTGVSGRSYSQMPLEAEPLIEPLPGRDLLPSSQAGPAGLSAGEAAKFGIFYDDRAYDYTKHLKKIGEVPGGVFIPGGADDAKGGEEGFDADTEAAALNHATYDNMCELEDLDPGTRECLEALEDEAFEDEDGFEDDFVIKLNRDDVAVLAPVYNANFRQFRHSKQHRDIYVTQHSTEDDEDDISTASSASSYQGTRYAASLAITSIDSKFEALMKVYDDEDDELDEVEFSDDEHEPKEGKDNVEHRVVQEALDEFLARENEYIRPTVAERKKGAVALLDEMRRQMGPVPESYLDRLVTDSEEVDIEDPWSSSDSDDSIDCQSSVISLSNSLNLPMLIREPSGKKKPDPIRLSRRTGMPVLPEDSMSKPTSEDEPRENKGQSRAREETAEEKKARKAAVRTERREKRVQKKDLKVRFKLGEMEEKSVKFNNRK